MGKAQFSGQISPLPVERGLSCEQAGERSHPPQISKEEVLGGGT